MNIVSGKEILIRGCPVLQVGVIEPILRFSFPFSPYVFPSEILSPPFWRFSLKQVPLSWRWYFYY